MNQLLTGEQGTGNTATTLLQNDVIVIEHLSELGESTQEVTEKLKYFRDKGIQLNFEGTTVDAQIVLNLVAEFDSIRRMGIREAQYVGIKKALEKKKAGKGSYGRPSIQVPKNFAQTVMELKKEKKELSSYCESLNMAKSTFYKYVKLLCTQRGDEDGDSI